VTHPDLADDMSVSDLTGSIEIRRSDSLIVLTTRSREAAFATDKLQAVVAAYIALNLETEESRSAVRLSELHDREQELVERLDLRADQLEIGGEYGISAISRAHVEKIAQIDALDARLSEIENPRHAGGEHRRDLGRWCRPEIMRATHARRHHGALGFERARMMSELAGCVSISPTRPTPVSSSERAVAGRDRRDRGSARRTGASRSACWPRPAP
jgi:hypothetical protein